MASQKAFARPAGSASARGTCRSAKLWTMHQSSGTGSDVARSSSIARTTACLPRPVGPIAKML